MGTHLPYAVLLDVDGTLLDTNPLHVVAWQRAFHRFGFDVPMQAIHGCIGMGGDQLVNELLGHDGPNGLADARQEEFRALWPDVRPLPGATDLIRVLDGAGLRVVLASSSAADELEFFRSVLDVDEHLAAGTSGDDAPSSKPAPDILLAAVERVGVTADQAILVGDTIWDVRAAEAAGMDAIGVLSGGVARNELVAEGAAAVYSGVDALVENLDSSPIARFLRPALAS